MLQRGRTEISPGLGVLLDIYNKKDEGARDSRQRSLRRITKLAWGLRRIVGIESGGTLQRRMLFVSFWRSGLFNG